MYSKINHPSPAVAAREGLLLLARGRSLYRAGEIDRPDPISSLDHPSYEIARQVFRGTPKPQHDPSGFHPSRTMDQESLSCWWPFNGTVRFRPKADMIGLDIGAGKQTLDQNLSRLGIAKSPLYRCHIGIFATLCLLPRADAPD